MEVMSNVFVRGSLICFFLFVDILSITGYLNDQWLEIEQVTS